MSTKRSRKKLRESLVAVGWLVGLGVLFVLGIRFRWLMLLICLASGVFLIGNLLVYGTLFFRDAKRGEKWFAAILMAVLAVVFLYAMIYR